MWEFHDGYYLSKGVDLHRLVLELDPDRLMNLFEVIIFEDTMENAKTDDERSKSRTKLINLRERGTIEYEHGWTNDDTNWQPDRAKPKPMPTYTEPTDTGYPGLEAPVG